MHLSVSHTSASMAPRWTAADDTAVSAAASARSGRAWPDWVDCPNRGRITADEASKRHCVLGKRPRPRGTIENGEVPSADPAVKPAAQRTQRSTPMRDRAEKVGVVVKPTPDGLREAVASRFLAADDRRGAACLLHKHQKEVQQTVARAEKREVRLRDMHALRERLRIQRRQLWKTFNMQSDDTDGDAPGLCVEVGAGERLEFELETRDLEQGMIARLSDKERTFF